MTYLDTQKLFGVYHHNVASEFRPVVEDLMTVSSPRILGMQILQLSILLNIRIWIFWPRHQMRGYIWRVQRISVMFLSLGTLNMTHILYIMNMQEILQGMDPPIPIELLSK